MDWRRYTTPVDPRSPPALAIVLRHELLKPFACQHGAIVVRQRHVEKAVRKSVLAGRPAGEHIDLTLRCNDAAGGFMQFSRRHVPPGHMPQHLRSFTVEVREH